MSPKYIFLRHGEAKHNVAFHQKGISAFLDEANKDAHLTEKGIEQAREVGKKLSSLKILDIWCSPLTRCIQTANEVFEEVNVEKMYLHDNLLERLGGGHICNERKPKSELKKEYGFLWNMSELPDYPPMWIERENNYALRQRMYMFIMLLEDIYKDASSDDHILIVSHNDAICTLTGKGLSNAEYVVLTLKEIETY